MTPLDSTRLWVERLSLGNFRSYETLMLELEASPIVLVGANGAGKTNILEAVSLLAPGQGLRQSPFPDLTRSQSDAVWHVAARVHTELGPVSIGTGLTKVGVSQRPGRAVRIDGETKNGSGSLADYVEMVWLTPATDGLFTGSGTERRRFFDRMILCFDPAHRTRAGRYERAMSQRNRLLADGVTSGGQLDGLELVMAEMGVALAAARAEAVAALLTVIGERRDRDPHSPFPWCQIALSGEIDQNLADSAAVDVEDRFAARLRQVRDRDRGAGRALDGPHRTDFLVTHGPKDMAARLCSTGEQKALLLGLVLAHAELVTLRREARAPILLLDEVTAHLDEDRRAALFAELVRLGSQAWLTGTDQQAFAALAGNAQFWRVESGQANRID